ncbi:MAG: hypothetical protein ABL931_00220 [Usitatibacteraceae bacterium]
MKTTGFPAPINDAQKAFKEICELGGGPHGGPPRGKVQEVLHQAGKSLNAFAYDEISEHMDALSDRNPWHVCFAVGLSWGHLADLDLTFTEAAVNCLEDWNGTDLATACSYHLERGPEPIHDSLSGALQLFEKVKLPEKLPTDLAGIRRAQERWLSPILSPSRPKYIGSWNATAMFMVALFAQPDLAATMTESTFMLPPGGPIFNGLKLLRKAHVLTSDPVGSELDDEAFEPGALYLNNDLMAGLIPGHTGWSMLEVHSGIYMLGTRHPMSNQWLK